MMKNILLTLIVFGLVGCATNYAHLSRTEEMLISGYTIQEIERAKQNGTFNMLVSQARSSGVSQRALEQYQYSSSMQNKIARYRESKRQYEYNSQQQAIAKKAKQQEEERRRIAQAQQAQYNAYINQKKATCKSYGYSESNGMAQCVEREINAERARLNAQAAQQNRINQENFQRQQQGLRDLADIFGKMGEGNYGQPKTSICNFKSFEGGIISGDCKQLTIKVGNTTYWKMD